MVDLRTQFEGIKEEVLSGFQSIFESGAFINGPMVKNFCESLSQYLQVAHTIPCANGTDALQAALMALNFSPGDEIITTPFTFIATAEVITLLGLKPVFVDIEPQTFNIDVRKIETAITPKTRCIMPVHLYGQCADMESILAIAEKHNLYVIEDNAQSIGATYTFSDGRKQMAGTMGHIGCTSFYPSKNLGAYGDAGAIFTNDDALAQALHMIVNHGQKEKYTSDVIGINSRLDSFQAVVLHAKLKKLPEYITARQAAAAFYDEAFTNIDALKIPFRSENSTHVFHQYTLITDLNRDDLRAHLSAHNVPSMVYYPFPLHLNKAFAYLNHKKGDFPVSEHMALQTISLPMHTELTPEQLKYISSTIISYCTKK
ncbi:MAG: DegT/DnrJ/EryC1/StrS family aminotransferase [Bacteroidetes bacterium]|nr:DegT/DnrJ/EryC1/StrS family aminotransferase [Bacteroidota bacterium]MCB9043168.1 DegT/DnrJ/EryC1/StrS family aminotransferase [Chitinophagales bacterium]